MKFMFLILAVVLSIVSCKKSIDLKPFVHEKAAYYVGAISGTDTSYTPGMWARVETQGLDSANDGSLKVVLVSYQNIGGKAYYGLEVTNLTDCQRILRWHWENIGVTSIEPNDSSAYTDSSDVIRARQVKRYTVIGNPAVGKIQVQAQKSNSNCPNSSTLVINITTSILPIRWIAHTTSYDDKNHMVNISFTVDNPLEADKFIIERQVSGPCELIYQFTSDKKTKTYNIPIFTDENN